MAARSENMHLLKKNYKKKIILIDRFIDSTIAYQHFGFGVKLSLIKIINNHLLNNFEVNFTFLNIVNQNNMIKRLKQRKLLNRYDKFDQNFYNKVQRGFIRLASQNKEKYQIIDSNLDIGDNKALIIKSIEKLIK